MKKLIWLSYDLSVRGDYEGMYAWLDDNNARECGDSLAAFSFEVASNEDLISKIKEEINLKVHLKSRDRVYLIWKDSGKMKGRYIFGKRKASPWEGYGSREDSIDIEDS